MAGLPAAEVRALLDSRSYFPSPAQQAQALEDDGFVVRSLEYFARRTPLEGTVADWAAHFRPDVLALVAPADRPRLGAAIDAQAEALGLRDEEGWYADYVRLRFVAHAV